MSKDDLKSYIERFDCCMEAIHKSIQAFPGNEIATLDLTISQIHVLMTLKDCNNCKMGELAKRLNVTMGNITSMIDRLQRDGYVKRSPDPKDRRIIHIQLTQKSKNAIIKIMGLKRRHLSIILSKIPGAEREKLLGILEKIAGAIGKERKIYG